MTTEPTPIYQEATVGGILFQTNVAVQEPAAPPPVPEERPPLTTEHVAVPGKGIVAVTYREPEPEPEPEGEPEA